MKKAINKIALISILFVSLISCENEGYEDYTVKSNASVDLNGEWFIDITNASTGVLEEEHALHQTFDSNDGKMYIDDHKNGWWLKGKLVINTSDLTFSAKDEPNLLEPGTTFTITEGKITKGGGISKDGNVVDKIYFKAEFSYEPGVIYIHEGIKRTKFLEDEY